uniref:Uncharacterized protein n=1 Tax=Phlebotomus papatasi TaxID=29031 RepID=A0A1B0DLL0_PHLPP
GLNVTHWATPAYSPQSNPTERANRTIITAIRAYISKKHNDWPKYLPEIGVAIRSSVHDGTQYTPYFLNFGQEMIVDGNEYAVECANKQLSLEERLEALELGRGVSVGISSNSSFVGIVQKTRSWTRIVKNLVYNQVGKSDVLIALSSTANIWAAMISTHGRDLVTV